MVLKYQKSHSYNERMRGMPEKMSKQGRWQHRLEFPAPSRLFIGKDGLHCILKQPVTELSKFQELVSSHNGLNKNNQKNCNSWHCAYLPGAGVSTRKSNIGSLAFIFSSSSRPIATKFTKASISKGYISLI